ncbi:MAG: RNA polymerase sigma factor [Acidobacteriota bacterium]
MNPAGGALDLHDTFTDEELMARAAVGDRDALGILVRRHQSGVYSIARRYLGDGSEAEDVAQDVFLRLWQAAARYRPEKPLPAYLRTITVNLCLDRRRRPALVPIVDPGAIQGTSDSEAGLLAAERQVALQKALAGLPPAQRMAVVLFHLEGLPVAETARLLDVGVKAAESLLSRARRSLRESLADILD